MERIVNFHVSDRSDLKQKQQGYRGHHGPNQCNLVRNWQKRNQILRKDIQTSFQISRRKGQEISQDEQKMVNLLSNLNIKQCVTFSSKIINYSCVS
jgi:hypothetical protein